MHLRATLLGIDGAPIFVDPLPPGISLTKAHSRRVALFSRAIAAPVLHFVPV
jgi:hypothetical protein